MNIIDLTDDGFTEILNDCLLPSSPIRREELLRGRTQQLDQIKKALLSPGRNVFIYGDRGVGKTSLAQTAAYLHQSSDSNPVIVACDITSSCFRIVQTVSNKLLGENPAKAKATFSKKANLGYKFFGAEIQKSLEEGKIPLPSSVDEAINLLHFSASAHSKSPIIVVDEFERITDSMEKQIFGDLIKQISDQSIPAKFIFCGVGSSLEDLLSGHESCYRYLSAVHLDRLKFDPRIEIIEHAALRLGVTISRDYKVRIALISDGFPHYVHLIGSKLFWAVYEDLAHPSDVFAHHFSHAVSESISDVEAHLRKIYEKATQKYNDEYQYILWAVADHPDLKRRSIDIYNDSYVKIMTQLGIIPLDRNKFNTRINTLKKESHAKALKANRQGWYEFTEPVLRGYCRLRAQERNVILDREHYLEMAKSH